MQANGSTEAPPPGSESDRRSWQLLGAAVGVPLLVTALLYVGGIPLGDPDWLVYRYSPFVGQRLVRALAVLPMGVACSLGVFALASPARAWRRAGTLLIGVGCVGLATWAHVAPPSHQSQHFFNLRSPSQDGAFVLEAEGVGEVRAYLRDFAARAATPPQQMRGTRVVSNPPGTTILAVGTARLLARYPALFRWLDPGPEADGLTPDERRMVAEALGFAWLLTGMWLASVPFLYLSAREFLPPAAAAVLAICCFFSPLTLPFTPGKDPAQMLTIALPLWLWLRASRRHRWLSAFLAGGFFPLTCLVSLVHVWIAAVVVLACGLRARRAPRGLGRFGRAVLIPAVVGSALVALALYLGWGCNVAAVAGAVAKAQSAVTRGPGTMPLALEWLGLPVFLLLVGPAWWCLLLWTPKPRQVPTDGRLGLTLLIGSAAVMVATIGFTNMETPRLWIAFMPLLLLGVGLQSVHPVRAARTTRLLIAALVLGHTACSALQWSFLDARESEMRLTTQQPRYFE